MNADRDLPNAERGAYSALILAFSPRRRRRCARLPGAVPNRPNAERGMRNGGKRGRVEGKVASGKRSVEWGNLRLSPLILACSRVSSLDGEKKYLRPAFGGRKNAECRMQNEAAGGAISARGTNNRRIVHRNLLWISNLSGTGGRRCHAGVCDRNTCITSWTATAQESAFKKAYPLAAVLFPVGMLRQAGVELLHQLGFVVARVSAAEERSRASLNRRTHDCSSLPGLTG